MIDIKAIAHRYGGTVSGGQALIPAIGHSADDRGVAIKAEPSAPHGCLIHCFNGGDPLAEKDRLRADGFLPRRNAEKNFWADSKGCDVRGTGPQPKFKTVATFEYANAEGEVIYRTVRREPENWTGRGKKPKQFRAERYEGGRWQFGTGDCERVPYRLPELIEAIAAGEPVYLVEGEAKADKLAAMGLAGTAIAFGANGWRAEYARHFEGAQVFILPDNDTPGRDFARRVYTDLGGRPSIVELPGLPEAGDIIDWIGTADELAALSANATKPDWLDQPGDTAKPSGGFQFVAVGDLKYRAPEFLIDEMIETETLGLAFGDPGCGKSFLAVDVGLSVASGTPFHGRKVKPGSVFFIAGEGHNGLARRFQAWSIARRVSLSGIPLFKSERAAQFLDTDSASAVAEAVQGLAAQHGDPALIIIDTLARNFGAGDENNTSDMSEFVAAIDNLKAQFSGCAVLIIHHSGHAEKGRARGAMALKGALDCEYRVEKHDHAIRLSCTKMKDALEPSDLFFALRDVDLGDNAQSAVLEATNAPERKDKISPTQRLALDAFIEAAAQSGAFEGAQFNGLRLDDWQPAFLSCHTGDNADSKKRAFRRARSELVKAGTLTVQDDLYSTDSTDILEAIQAKRTGRT